jgi:hypothetical protein
VLPSIEGWHRKVGHVRNDAPPPVRGIARYRRAFAAPKPAAKMPPTWQLHTLPSDYIVRP